MLNKTDENRIVAQLKLFGCNAREAEIYIQYLQTGAASIQQIAHKLKQNRVTVHNAVEQLIEKGLLFESRKGKRRLIVAEEPSVLYRLLQKRENELSLMKTNLDYVTKMLGTLQNEHSSVPTVRVFEGRDGFKKMLEETLTAKDEVLVFVYVELFMKLLSPEYLEQYYRRRSQKGIHTRLIFPTCPFAERVNKKAKEYKMMIRLLPPEMKWVSGIFCWNNCIALMSYTEQRLTCTIIENEDITNFYRNIIFELIWKGAVPMK
jgi:sugar-specific transcriptional regulator TrmB